MHIILYMYTISKISNNITSAYVQCSTKWPHREATTSDLEAQKLGYLLVFYVMHKSLTTVFI